MSTPSKDLRRGRHCVFLMHVHLVFVSKRRGNIFNKQALDQLHGIFQKVCEDFEATLIAFDGEADYVHLLIHYPPFVPIAKLVNSLKSISSRLLRKANPSLLEKASSRNALWSPNYFAGSCDGPSLEVIRQYIQQLA